MARRTLAAALCALAALMVPTAASAHQGSPDYESIVSGVKPAIEGLSVEVLNGDDRLEVTYRGSAAITIYGYNDEPYVRMDPDGTVSANLRSPAYYLNRDRLLGTAVPPTADADAAPRWRIVERSGRYEFHDHRMHWMAKNTPPQVKDRSERTKIFDWKVPVRQGPIRASIDGQLFWRGSSGGTPVAPFIALGVLAALGGAAVVVVRRRRGAPGETVPKGEAW
ncbi:MAG TPA: hypothetical protein VMY78_17295 [Solirubrobacteraceae bacterium]|nr:hypothetical protein [Solirubrobacteraceae bacterium]